MGSETDTIVKFLPSASYLFTQSALLALHYGFRKALPGWVLWFPTLVTVGIIALALIAVLVILGIAAAAKGD
jgi:hypothetical protein